MARQAEVKTQYAPGTAIKNDRHVWTAYGHAVLIHDDDVGRRVVDLDQLQNPRHASRELQMLELPFRELWRRFSDLKIER